MKKILVINDEMDTNFFIASALKNKGYMIENAKDLREGKDIFLRMEPDLLFLDINLPDGNGLESIPYFKGESEQLKICIISANDDAIKAYSLKADAYLVKPFSLAQIIDKTKELIG